MADAALASPDGFDLARLADWIAGSVDGFTGPIEVERFAGGQSNPTYRLRSPGGDYVMRTKPPGETLSSAHAVDREYRVMGALQDSTVPVPRVRALCEDPSVIGRSFYIMDFVQGDIFWRPDLPEIVRERRADYFDALNRTLASLHRIDPASVGLSAFGKDGDYLRRQIERWTQQYRAGHEAGRIDRMDRLAAWLAENVPQPGGRSIVHGDFRINNVMFAPGQAQTVAVLDWELSTIGDPVTDFAYHLMAYRVPHDIQGGGLAGLDLDALGLPSEADYIDAYCERVGRTTLPNLQFHVAFNLFRFAAIIHGIKGRAMRGNASSTRADEVGAALETYVDLAWDQARQAGLK
ncbi:MAG: aminoglycoside phosphotransferase [Sphingomonadales bacterium RIFCSPHIGHO2_01_FULL_65_20]|jgi:aminoglycoside phosphotransferase (APT) family kinase protein|nr:MAG: aminoglycoside phosphotransferase [Sphingomonadales bacterium RIFCSPHIGHO2_01_FULL_65_20]